MKNRSQHLSDSHLQHEMGMVKNFYEDNFRKIKRKQFMKRPAAIYSARDINPPKQSTAIQTGLQLKAKKNSMKARKNPKLDAISV